MGTQQSHIMGLAQKSDMKNHKTYSYHYTNGAGGANFNDFFDTSNFYPNFGKPASQECSHCISFHGYNPNSIAIQCTATGELTVSGMKSFTEKTTTGERTLTTKLEEKIVLPEYLVKQKLLNKLESTMKNQFLIISYPQNVIEIEEKNSQEEVKIPIHMDIINKVEEEEDKTEG